MGDFLVLCKRDVLSLSILGFLSLLLFRLIPVREAELEFKVSVSCKRVYLAYMLRVLTFVEKAY
jgi:hypothetical protein